MNEEDEVGWWIWNLGLRRKYCEKHKGITIMSRVRMWTGERNGKVIVSWRLR